MALVGSAAVGMALGVTAVNALDIVTVAESKEIAGISSVGDGVGGTPATVRTEEPAGPCCTHTDWPTNI
jgi:hypothetical protein